MPSAGRLVISEKLPLDEVRARLRPLVGHDAECTRHYRGRPVWHITDVTYGTIVEDGAGIGIRGWTTGKVYPFDENIARMHDPVAEGFDVTPDKVWESIEIRHWKSRKQEWRPDLPDDGGDVHPYSELL
ncbi:MAG: hypothetical protein FJY76_01120 [Candidatus Aenigmarchaeota archaeon]|nr:hypothetical protein [Candidatus Aenigmarchaeota archaeon]